MPKPKVGQIFKIQNSRTKWRLDAISSIGMAGKRVVLQAVSDKLRWSMPYEQFLRECKLIDETKK